MSPYPYVLSNTTASDITWTYSDNGTSTSVSPDYVQAAYQAAIAHLTSVTMPVQWTISDITPQPVLGKRVPQRVIGNRKKGARVVVAKFIHNPPPREFNKFINASDMMEEFIKWLGTQNVKQHEVLDLPIDLFIKWLIIRACESEQEEPGVVLQLPAPKKQPRCLGCGQFMSHKALPMPMHSQYCSVSYFKRQEKVNAITASHS